jgi:hypothetical protein
LSNETTPAKASVNGASNNPRKDNNKPANITTKNKYSFK